MDLVASQLLNKTATLTSTQRAYAELTFRRAARAIYSLRKQTPPSTISVPKLSKEACVPSQQRVVQTVQVEHASVDGYARDQMRLLREETPGTLDCCGRITAEVPLSIQLRMFDMSAFKCVLQCMKP